MNNADNHFPRVLRQGLLSDLRIYPVVAVMGARQVGKSTLCRQLAGNLGLASRTLDDRDVREQAMSDPEGFLDGLGTRGAFIDEAQRAPDLMLAIKAVVDRENRPGRYLLSGSNQPTIGKAVGDSLLGRAAYRTLRPLTLSELRFAEEHPGWSFLFGANERAIIQEMESRAAQNGRLRWKQTVGTGGFPRSLKAPEQDRLRLLDDYIEVFSRRDMRELIAVGSTERLGEFVRLTAARTGHELNFSGLANQLGTPVTTIRRWLGALQRSYLVELVPAYSRNAGTRVIRAPKLYFVDPALAMAAARDTTPSGFHFETLIATDLLVWRDGAPGRALYHWRESSGPEVDFVLEEESKLVLVEVKADDSVGSGDARHMNRFREKYGATLRGVLVSNDPSIRQVVPGVLACPWWAIV